MQIPRRYTTAGRDPFAAFSFVPRTSRITNPDGSLVFEMKNIRSAVGVLAPGDRLKHAWDPEGIDWADYWVNVHTKGIEKWIRPMFVSPRRSSSA